MPARTPAQWVVYWMIVAVLLLPGVPISLAWNRVRRVSRALFATGRWTLVALSLQTVSFVYICLGLLNRIAPAKRSHLQYTLIFWIAVCALTLVLAKRKSDVQGFVQAAGVFLLIDWFYFLVINSVV